MEFQKREAVSVSTRDQATNLAIFPSLDASCAPCWTLHFPPRVSPSTSRPTRGQPSSLSCAALRRAYRLIETAPKALPSDLSPLTSRPWPTATHQGSPVDSSTPPHSTVLSPLQTRRVVDSLHSHLTSWTCSLEFSPHQHHTHDHLCFCNPRYSRRESSDYRVASCSRIARIHPSACRISSTAPTLFYLFFPVFSIVLDERRLLRLNGLDNSHGIHRTLFLPQSPTILGRLSVRECRAALDRTSTDGVAVLRPLPPVSIEQLHEHAAAPDGVGIATVPAGIATVLLHESILGAKCEPLPDLGLPPVHRPTPATKRQCHAHLLGASFSFLPFFWCQC